MLHLLYRDYVAFAYVLLFVFFFNNTATAEIYTLSLHDALPISEALEHVDEAVAHARMFEIAALADTVRQRCDLRVDRKSTRLNSSHPSISYAVFCLKKKKITQTLDSPANCSHITLWN